MKLLLFSGEWCSPCQALKPIFLDLQKEYLDKGVDFGIFDAVERKDIARTYFVRSVPTIVFTDDKGVQLDVLIGLVSREDIVDMIRELGGPV